MTKVAPLDEDKSNARKKMKFQNYEDALSSRYQTSGPKVDAKDDKDRFVLFTYNVINLSFCFILFKSVCFDYVLNV